MTDERFGDAWRLERRENGVRMLWFDRQGSPENTLDRPTVVELGEAIKAVARDEGTRLLAIRGGKHRGFCGGTDLRPFRSGLKPVELRGIGRLGLEVFDRIEALPVPTVAVVHGQCLGGGLELALACRQRLAIEGAGATLGITEVKLNLVPAWGGLDRLPRLVGLAKALDLLVSGRTVDLVEANRIGLVDAIVASARIDGELAHLAARDGRIEPAPWPPEAWKEEIASARKRLKSGPDEHRRAREVLLDAVEADLTRGRDAGRDAAVIGLATLARSREARDAIEHFFTRPGRAG